MLVKTENGTVYQFVTIYNAYDQPRWYMIRRPADAGGELWGDDTYIEVMYEPYAVVGESMTLYLDPKENGDRVIARTTSRVVTVADEEPMTTIPQEIPREQGLW